VAQFTAQIVARLAGSPAGTRVVPPELVWQASQTQDIGSLAHDWLHGTLPPEPTPRPMRM
jgi:hypothetical protein